MTTSSTKGRPAAPTEQDAALARRSGRQLARFTRGDLRVRLPRTRQDVTIPEPAVRLLVDMLSEMAQGHAVSVTPIRAELTTQQAADFLGVSRPFLIKQLEAHQIPFHKVGTHRRVLLKDLAAYQRAIDKRRRSTLDALAAQAQKLNMGY